MKLRIVCCALALAGCTGGHFSTAPGDLGASPIDLAGASPIDLAGAAPIDLASAAPIDLAAWCEWSGAPGACMDTSACAAIADHTSESGSCPGPTNIQCCIVTPSVADNPPTPAGYRLMKQSEVTSAMTDWAVMILHDPIAYPMFSETVQTFGTQQVLARVEWHPPDFQNGVIHRGVTLYVPL